MNLVNILQNLHQFCEYFFINMVRRSDTLIFFGVSNSQVHENSSPLFFQGNMTVSSGDL